MKIKADKPPLDEEGGLQAMQYEWAARYLDGSAAQSRSEPANLRAKLVIAWSRFTGLAG